MAAIIDLIHCESGEAQASCDVCIVGAGAAGLYLASRLARAGVRVVVLEAGGTAATPGADIGIEAVFDAAVYGGAVEGRAFGWGGSTARWGGVVIPYSDLDLREDEGAVGDAWRRIVGVVSERRAAVFAKLGIDPDASAATPAHLARGAARLRECGFETVLARALPFRYRNLTRLVNRRDMQGLTVYLNATVCEWSPVPGALGRAQIRWARAAAPGRAASVRVRARRFVVAAGAIESARILLEIDASARAGLLRNAATGRYLSDHLSCAIAEVLREDANAAAAQFGPGFSAGGCMSTLRIVEKTRDADMPRHFAHFIFDIDNAGFRLLKELLRAVQSRTAPRTRAGEIVDGIAGLSRLALDRAARARLHVPAGTPAHLQLDVEQTPLASNRVRLGSALDRFGRRVGHVNWEIGEADYRRMRAVSERVLGRWSAGRGLPRLRPLDPDEGGAKPHDAYHPVGTCRMGDDDEATVNDALRVAGAENLFVLSTGVLPSAGGANPTFSMLCLGDRLADELARGLQNEGTSTVKLPC
jgi:choline dehydrogenase-like flavoprotein